MERCLTWPSTLFSLLVRNRYLLVANLGSSPESLSPVATMYQMGKVEVDTTGARQPGDDVIMTQSSLLPGEAIVVKLPK